MIRLEPMILHPQGGNANTVPGRSLDLSRAMLILQTKNQEGNLSGSEILASNQTLLSKSMTESMRKSLSIFANANFHKQKHKGRATAVAPLSTWHEKTPRQAYQKAAIVLGALHHHDSPEATQYWYSHEQDTIIEVPPGLSPAFQEDATPIEPEPQPEPQQVEPELQQAVPEPITQPSKADTHQTEAGTQPSCEPTIFEDLTEGEQTTSERKNSPPPTPDELFSKRLTGLDQKTTKTEVTGSPGTTDIEDLQENALNRKSPMSFAFLVCLFLLISTVLIGHLLKPTPKDLTIKASSEKGLTSENKEGPHSVFSEYQNPWNPVVYHRSGEEF